MDNTKLDKEIESLKDKLKTNALYIGYNLVASFNDTSLANAIISKADYHFFEYLTKKRYVCDYQLIILALIIVGLKDYDGAFWCHVEDRFYFSYEESGKSSGFVNEKLRDVIRKFFSPEDSDNRLINYVLKQAVMPVQYLHNYFELMFDIYKKNLYFYLGSDKEVEEDLRIAFSGIANTGKTGADDEFRSEATNKVYVLIKSSREVMTEPKGISSLLDLSLDVLKIIDAYYNSLECECLDNTYYKTGFDNWLKYHVNKKELRKDNNSERIANGWKYNQSPFFELYNDDVYLTIPARKISSEHDPNLLCVKLYNEDKLLLESEDFIVEQQIGVNIIKPRGRLKVLEPIGKLRYEFECDGNVIYSSTDKLFRNYIVFDNKGLEITNNKNTKGIIKIVSKDFDNQSLQIIKKTVFYCIGITNIDEDGYFYLFNELVNITGSLSSGLVGERYDNTYLIYDNEFVDVYKRVDKLIIETELSTSLLSLWINEEEYLLSDLPLSIKRNGTGLSYIVDLELMDAVSYDIKTVNNNDGSIIGKEQHFIIDKNLKYEYHDGILTYSSSLLDSNDLLNDINDESTYSPMVAFSDDLGVEYEYKYFFPYGLELVRIDRNKWQTMDELWGADIKPHSQLMTYGLFCDQVVVFDTNNNRIGLLSVKSMKTGVTIDCTSLLALKKKFSSVKLKFYKNGSIKQTIDCYFACVIDEGKSVFKYDENRNALIMNVSYHGKGRLLASINKRTNITIDYSNKYVSVPNISLFTPVEITITELRLGQTNKPILIKNLSFISLHKLDNHIFEMKKFIYEEYVKNKKYDREIEAARTYLYIKQKQSDSTYIGEVFSGRIDNKRYLNRINPVIIEVISEELFSENLFSVAITTQEGDGLFLNKTYSTIINSDYSKDAPDIVTYELAYAGDLW